MRDEAGNYLGASSVVVLGITDPNCLEAMACGEALSLEEDMGLRRLTIGSDCLQSCVLSMAMWCVRLKLHLQVSTLLFFDMRVGILIGIIWREGLHRGRLAAMFDMAIHPMVFVLQTIFLFE
jgi:hypothetical protein